MGLYLRSESVNGTDVFHCTDLLGLMYGRRYCTRPPGLSGGIIFPSHNVLVDVGPILRKTQILYGVPNYWYFLNAIETRWYKED